MLDAYPTRLALRVEFIAAIPIDGTDRMLVTVRTDAASALELKLTRPEAAELVALISAERSRAPLDGADPVDDGWTPGATADAAAP